MYRANRAQFLDLPLRHIPEDCEIPSVALPSVQGDDSGLPEGVVEPIGEPEFTGVYTTPEQLSDELVTLSLIPRSRWQTLLNLDTIKVRFFTASSCLISQTGAQHSIQVLELIS